MSGRFAHIDPFNVRIVKSHLPRRTLEDGKGGLNV
jgi:hypothetical protein